MSSFRHNSIAWEKYRDEFRLAAAQRAFDEAYVGRCLRYAEPLFVAGFPVIYTQEHLASLVGYSVDLLRRASNRPARFYRRFNVRKRSGGDRQIAEPLPALKEVQRWILRSILGAAPVHPAAKGFVEGRSIRDNARFHRGQRVVVNLDVEDFFGSVRSSSVASVFLRMGYRRSVVAMLTGLTTLNDALPQGAPTSPALSNLVLAATDARIFGFARKQGIRYTRYADDITFSGDLDPGVVVRFTAGVLADVGLRLNRKKTRVMRQSARQEATGIVVNRTLHAPRSLRRGLRQVAYYIRVRIAA